MTTKIKDGGPAFPCEAKTWDPDAGCYAKDYENNYEGMTLRDYFAAKALAGLCANREFGWQGRDAPGALAGMAYKIANAMSAER